MHVRRRLTIDIVNCNRLPVAADYTLHNVLNLQIKVSASMITDRLPKLAKIRFRLFQCYSLTSFTIRKINEARASITVNSITIFHNDLSINSYDQLVGTRGYTKINHFRSKINIAQRHSRWLRNDWAWNWIFPIPAKICDLRPERFCSWGIRNNNSSF